MNTRRNFFGRALGIVAAAGSAQPTVLFAQAQIIAANRQALLDASKAGAQVLAQLTGSSFRRIKS